MEEKKTDSSSTLEKNKARAGRVFFLILNDDFRSNKVKSSLIPVSVA